ncbi:MAG: hypothetical protein FWF10_05330 [Clostridiales bacterium]|nr:hypothetical protein [Clostridiales bacterium]
MVGHIGKQLINIRKTALSAEAKIWNRFIDEFCDRPIEELTPLQRNAVLPYWYDCEINSDGHADYVPLCNADSRDALARCLKEIGAEDFAANFLSACASGAQDDYSRADHWFGNRKPTLTSIMMAYVLEHAGGIFD